MTRGELLEQLYDFVWNSMSTLESDREGLSYIPDADLEHIEHICSQIENMRGNG